MIILNVYVLEGNRPIDDQGKGLDFRPLGHG